MGQSIHVTSHAMRRYLERVVGVDFSWFDRKRWPDTKAVDAVCEEAGIDPVTLEDIIRRDVEPRVPITARVRGSRCIVRGETAKYIIVSGNAVATVMPLGAEVM